ncbi:MAG: hypothetical protein FWE74_02295 [Oscillospiraceae bacterium]|nr:hypothetical protein [Oscillospiraceae bacterium]
MFKKRKQLKYLKEHGVKTEAKLINVKNKQPEVEFIAGGERFRKLLDIRSDFYESYIGKLIGVRYDPEDPRSCCAEDEIKRK